MRDAPTFYALSANLPDSVTLQLSKYDVTPSCCLWDAWGWNGRNYAATLCPLLRGHLKEGVQEQVAENAASSPSALRAVGTSGAHYASGAEDSVHAVVLVVDATSVTNGGRMAVYREFYKKLVKEGS